LHQLRVTVFSEKDAAALFALEELRDTDALRRMEIFEDSQLSAEQKLQAYAKLDASLPARLKEEREAPPTDTECGTASGANARNRRQ
jgi:lipase chaperone LimK